MKFVQSLFMQCVSFLMHSVVSTSNKKSAEISLQDNLLCSEFVKSK